MPLTSQENSPSKIPTRIHNPKSNVKTRSASAAEANRQPLRDVPASSRNNHPATSSQQQQPFVGPQQADQPKLMAAIHLQGRIFTGTSEDPFLNCISTWLNDMDDLGTAIGYTDENKLALIPTYLSGYAKEIWTSLAANQRDTYGHARDALRAALRPRDYVAQKTAVFNSTAIQKKESVRQFLTRLRKLCNQAHGGAEFTDAARQILLKNKLLSSLPSEYQMLNVILDTETTTLDDLLQQAERIETQIKAKESSTSTIVPETATKQDGTNNVLTSLLLQQLQNLTIAGARPAAPIPPTQSKHLEHEIQALHRENNQMMRKMDDVLHSQKVQVTTRPTQGKEMKCWNCGLTGHMRRDCRRAPQQFSGRGNNTRPWNVKNGNYQNYNNGPPQQHYNRQQWDDRRRNVPRYGNNGHVQRNEQRFTKRNDDRNRNGHGAAAVDIDQSESDDGAYDDNFIGFVGALEMATPVKSGDDLARSTGSESATALQGRRKHRRSKRKRVRRKLVNFEEGTRGIWTKCNGCGFINGPLWTIPAILFLITCIFAVAAATQQFLVCGEGKFGFMVDVPRHVKCVPPANNSMVSQCKVTLWVPREDPAVVDAWRCRKRLRKICTHTSFFGGKGIVADLTDEQPVMPNQCRELVQQSQDPGKSTADGMTLYEREPGFFTTNKTMNVVYKWCCYDHCSEVINTIVEKGQIATMDGVTLISDLGDTSHCNAAERLCIISEGTIVWKENKLPKVCSMVAKGPYDAQCSEKHIVIPGLQSAFSVSKNHIEHNSPDCLPTDILWTDQGMTVQINKEHGMRTIRRATVTDKYMAQRNRYNIDRREMDPENPKLQFLLRTITKQMITGFDTVWRKLCDLFNAHLDTTWSFLAIDPTVGARLLLKRNDISASFAGDVLVITQCRRVNGTRRLDKNINGTCHSYVPVQVDNKLMFQIPGTKELTMYSSTVDCTHAIAPVYRDDNGAYKNANNVTSHVTQIPIAISWQGHWKPFVFSSPTLFHDTLATGAQMTMLSLKGYLHRTIRLETSLANVINYTASMSLNPSVIANALKGIGQGGERILTGVGEGLEHIVIGIGQGGGELVSSVLTGPFQFAINAVVITLIVLVVGYVMYKAKIWKLCGKKHKKPFSPDVESQPLNADNQKRAISPQKARQYLFWLENSIKTKEQQQRDRSAAGKPKKPEEPFRTAVKVKLAGATTVKCLYDTGATLSLIREDVIERLPARARKIKPQITQATQVNNDTLTMKGTIKIPVRLGTFVKRHKFHVVSKDCPYQCLIGTDFQQKLGRVLLDYKKKQIELADGCRIYLETGSKSTTEINEERIDQTTIRIKDKTIIQPHTRAHIEAILEQKLDTNAIVVDQTNHLQEHANVMVPRQLLMTPKHNQTFVLEVTNPLAHSVALYAGQTIGEACAMDTQKDVTQCESKTHEKRKTAYDLTKRRQEIEALVDKIDVKNKTVNKQEIDILKDMIRRRWRAIAADDQDLGMTATAEHRIELTEPGPYYKPQYRLPQAQREAVEKLVDQMLKKGVVEDSKSPWNSPLILVRKKSGDWRPCIDYRWLNSITKADRFPIPLIEDVIIAVAGSKYFTSLDLMQGYWQVRMNENDKEKTAFSTPSRHLQFTRMPFGLMNAPATFQRTMNLILSGLTWKILFVYIDDILIFSKTFEEHVKHLDEVLKRLEEANMKVKLSKCVFCREEVPYLGYVISKEGLKPDPEKIKAIAEFPRPANVDQVRQFLGILGFSRKFIQHASTIAKPLNDLMKSGAKFDWTPESEDAFVTLKKALSTAPVLAFANYEQDFIVTTDASGHGIGAVLSQIDKKGVERPIQFISRTLNKAERNYSTTEREFLAVVWVLGQFKWHCFGRRVHVRSDHRALASMLRVKKTDNVRMAKWLVALNNSNIDISYYPGKENKVADGLSRNPVAEAPTEELDIMEQYPMYPEWIAAVDLKTTDIRTQQSTDPDLIPIIRFLEFGILPDDVNQRHAINRFGHEYRMEDGILKHSRQNGPDRLKGKTQVVVPKSQKHDILRSFHDNPLTGGHSSSRRTQSKIALHYFWPQMTKDIENWCQSCDACQRRKPPRRYGRIPMMPTTVSEKPFDLMAVDVLGPIGGPTESGNKLLLICTEYLTRYAWAIPIPDQVSLTIATALVNNIFTKFGTPHRLLSDNGRNFTSILIQGMCDAMHIKKINTTPYHPQTDGVCERFNRTILDMLSCYVKQYPEDWDQTCHLVVHSYNITQHATTGDSPFYLMFGRDPDPPTEMKNLPDFRYIDHPTYKQKLACILNSAWTTVAQNISKAQSHFKAQYDKNSIPNNVKAGDRVYLKIPTIDKNIPAKLASLYKGPFRVIKISDLHATVVPCDRPRNKPKPYHKNLIKIAIDACQPRRHNEDSSASESSEEPTNVEQKRWAETDSDFSGFSEPEVEGDVIAVLDQAAEAVIRYPQGIPTIPEWTQRMNNCQNDVAILEESWDMYKAMDGQMEKQEQRISDLEKELERQSKQRQEYEQKCILEQEAKQDLTELLKISQQLCKQQMEMLKSNDKERNKLTTEINQLKDQLVLVTYNKDNNDSDSAESETSEDTIETVKHFIAVLEPSRDSKEHETHKSRKTSRKDDESQAHSKKERKSISSSKQRDRSESTSVKEERNYDKSKPHIPQSNVRHEMKSPLEKCHPERSSGYEIRRKEKDLEYQITRVQNELSDEKRARRNVDDSMKMIQATLEIQGKQMQNTEEARRTLHDENQSLRAEVRQLTDKLQKQSQEHMETVMQWTKERGDTASAMIANKCKFCATMSTMAREWEESAKNSEATLKNQLIESEEESTLIRSQMKEIGETTKKCLNNIIGQAQKAVAELDTQMTSNEIEDESCDDAATSINSEY